jgi:hypothetical protein
MKKFYGNYLGLCINNDDPQKRGRVQVFIPHIMPALFENWNEVGEDIKMLCVGDNLPDSLPSPVVEKLMKILPWSESASPILGSSSPGNLISNALNAIGNYFNQSPVPTPAGGEGGNTAPNADEQTLFNNAARYGPVGSSKFARARSRDGDCGRGTRQIIGALTNNSYFSNGLSIGGSAFAGSLSTGNNYLQNSGYYNTATSIPSNYVPQIGDVVSGTNSGAGHVQVYIGNGKWVSDFTQNGYLTNYGNLKLHRMNGNGLAAINKASPGLYASATGDATPNSSSIDEKNSPSGTVSAPTPHQDQLSLESDVSINLYGSIARPEVVNDTTSSETSTIQIGSNGTVDANSFRSYLEGRIADSKLNGYMPSDGAKHGIDGSPASWANYFYNLANRESSLNVNTVGDIGMFSGNSNGLFQLSPGDAVNYGLNGGRPFTQSQLTDPVTNTNAAIAIHESLVLRDGAIGSDSRTGAARYWGPLRRGWTSPPSSAFNPNNVPPASGATSPGSAGRDQSLVNNTDKHGAMAVVNLNNMAKGVFTYPAAGAVLWVFFREGDPNFPVYFAANYGEREWQSAYRMGSDAPGIKPGSTPENPVTSTGGIMNLNGVGGLRWEDTNVPDDPTFDQKSLTIFGYDGSNMHFNEGYHQIFSKFDRRDTVEGDRWVTTLGFKEEWVQGDSNEVHMGDVFVKIGNVSPPAVDAVTRIQQIIKECMQPVTESSGSAPTTSTAGKSKYSKSAAENSTIKTAPIGSPPSRVGGQTDSPSQIIANIREQQAKTISRQTYEEEYGTAAQKQEQETAAQEAGFAR